MGNPRLHQEARGGATPFERFESLTKRLVQVPKKEIDKKAKEFDAKHASSAPASSPGVRSSNTRAEQETVFGSGPPSGSALLGAVPFEKRKHKDENSR